MNAWIKAVGLVGFLLIISGCATQKISTAAEEKTLVTPPVKEERVVDPLAHLPAAPPPAAEPAPPPAPAPPPVSPPLPVTPAPPPTPSAEKTARFFFDILFFFDQHSLHSDAIAMVEVNATRLKEAQGKGWKLFLEGRGDEVGTTEYNLVLGEHRARAVKGYLVKLGLPSTSIDTVSYGKELPLCHEHSVECWKKNRSVRFDLK